MNEIAENPRELLPAYGKAFLAKSKELISNVAAVAQDTALMLFNVSQAEMPVKAGLYKEAEILIGQEAKRFEPIEKAVANQLYALGQKAKNLTLPKICRHGAAFVSESLITGGMVKIAGKTFKLARVGATRCARGAKELAKQSIESFGQRELLCSTPEGLLVQVRDKSLNLAQRTARNAGKMPGAKAASREIILPKVKTFEQARNKALELVGNLGPNSEPIIGKLQKSKGFGKIIGRMSRDKKLRWYFDYDPIKGLHINVHDFRLGKGINAKKYAIPFCGTEVNYESLLRHMNR